METASESVPDLVPARMLNEFAYCPRLFFLEWVQARFVDSDDTVQGRYHHRAAEDERGRVPLPDDGELSEARSVLLSSSELGLIARVDILEGEGGVVRPVDIKKGSPPSSPERSWEPERVQLCAQGLLLREAGYRCDEGVLYFADARRRVMVEFDEDLIARTLSLLTGLRAVAAQDLPPPPLIASRKCPRCSLVGICLPDETNALAARSQLPVRRLLPRDLAARPLYVTEQGAKVGVRENRIEIKRGDEVLESLRPIDVSQLCLFGNVQVTTQAMRTFFAREIPVCWFSYGGWFQGIAEGFPSKHVDLRRRQVAFSGQGGLAIARRMVEGKIRNCRTFLRRNLRRDHGAALDSLKELADSARDATSVAALLGLEGAAGRLYFEALPAVLREDLALAGGTFSFEGRNRRPPRDPLNCLLSYAYALLTKDLTAVAFAVGFDPYLGFYHRPRFGRPALALDLAEEFRPLVADSVVVGAVNNGEIRASYFFVRAGGVSLTQEGRRAMLRAYERRIDTQVRHPTFGYTITYRRVLEVQARLLAAHVLGEVPEYVPFMTR